MRIFKSLKQKLIFYLVLCTLLPALVIFFPITYMGTKIIKNQVSNELCDVGILLETHVKQLKRIRYVALIAIGSGIGCLVILTATFRTVRHIILIEDAIRNVSKGDLHVEYDFQSDELGSRLSASFSEMTTALKKSKEILRNLFDAANDPMFIIISG